MSEGHENEGRNDVWRDPEPIAQQWAADATEEVELDDDGFDVDMDAPAYEDDDDWVDDDYDQRPVDRHAAGARMGRGLLNEQQRALLASLSGVAQPAAPAVAADSTLPAGDVPKGRVPWAERGIDPARFDGGVLRRLGRERWSEGDALGPEFGVAPERYELWECGAEVPRPFEIAALAVAFGVAPEVLCPFAGAELERAAAEAASVAGDRRLFRGARLREARTAARLTQRELGQKLAPHVQTRYVSGWERDEGRPPSQDHLRQLARELRVSLEFLCPVGVGGA